MSPKIFIIIGSTRPGRRSEMVAKWVFGETKKRTDFDAQLIDLRDWPLPFYNEAMGPESLKGNYSLPLAKQWSQKVAEADGFLFVTPEYNHGYSAVMKNALDYVFYEWNKKPAAFISYGGSVGGSRSVEQLKLVSLELGMVPVRTAIHIPSVRKAFDETGQPVDPKFSEQTQGLLDELLWWTTALKTARTKGS